MALRNERIWCVILIKEHQNMVNISKIFTNHLAGRAGRKAACKRVSITTTVPRCAMVPSQFGCKDFFTAGLTHGR
jgi:hypothetical protein